MGECEILERDATLAEVEALEMPGAIRVLAVQRVMMSGGRPIAFLIDVVRSTSSTPGSWGTRSTARCWIFCSGGVIHRSPIPTRS